jgi:hypothetical protein
MNYWLCVVTSPISYERILSGRTAHLCLPKAAQPNDGLILYRGKRIAAGKCGIFARYFVKEKINDASDLCSAYYSSAYGKLMPFTCSLETMIDPVIQRAEIAQNFVWKNSLIFRRNFQGSVFQVTTSEWAAIESFR